ncbi:MAG: UvrD-helicase domain-containing protein [Oscillospiraceae bacterium]|nr:UvrD-helicase domain-containing protein [Oscillospiraceae bacterium]
MPELTPEQSLAVSSHGGALLVSAAAGAGKTKVLTERFLSYIRDRRCNADQFLVITYTRAAAGEMRTRILKGLETLCNENPEDNHLKAQLTRIYAAPICTLDAFCREILEENSPAAGISPNFRLGDESEMRIIREGVLQEILDRMYEEYGQEEHSPFLICAENFGDLHGDNLLADLVLAIWQKTRCHPEPIAWLEAFLISLEKGDANDWFEILGNYASELLLAYRGKYANIRPLMQNDPESKYLQNLDGDTDFINSFLSSWKKKDWTLSSSVLAEFSPSRLAPVRAEEKNEMCQRFAVLRTAFKKQIDKLKLYVYGQKDSHLEDIKSSLPVLRGLIQAVKEFDKALIEQKSRDGVLDFDDVKHSAWRLLTSSNGISQRYASRFVEIMVDEYQDINPLQDALINALSRGGGNVFYVGDVRQSIYRFQMANPAIFLDKYNRYPLCSKTADTHIPRKILLTKNFRSRPEILNAVNHVFSKIDCPEMGVLKREEYMFSDRCFDTPHPPPVEVLTFPPDNETDVHSQEAQVIAKHLRELTDSGQFKASECVILLRSIKGKLPYYRKALGAHGLNCSGNEERNFLSRPEIKTALAILEVIDNPLASIPMLLVLQSPIIRLTPEELADLRLCCPDGTLYDCMKASDNPKVAEFLKRLGHWRILAAELPPYALCARVTAETCLPAKYGNPARENLLVLPEILQAFQGRELRQLSDWIVKLAEKDDYLPGFTPNQDDSVKIMTIHKAKGLEFPVVVLAGLTKRFNTDDQKGRLLVHAQAGLGFCRRDELSEYPTIAHRAVKVVIDSEMRSEELRLLYVAMTRAESKLILSLGQTKEKNPDIFGFIEKGDFLQARCISDWLWAVKDPAWTVVSAEHGQPEEPGEVQKLAQPEHPGTPSNHSGQNEVLSYPFSEAVDTPSKLTATGLKGRIVDQQANQDAQQAYWIEPPASLAKIQKYSQKILSKNIRRPVFEKNLEKTELNPTQRGTALHLFMQFARYENCMNLHDIEDEKNRLVMQNFLTAQQAEAVSATTVLSFFKSRTGEHMLSSQKIYREQKFSLLIENNDIPGLYIPQGEKILLQGVIDCYFEYNDTLCLIDFKSDWVIPGQEESFSEKYRPQMDAYTAALNALYPNKKRIIRKIFFFCTRKAVEI